MKGPAGRQLVEAVVGDTQHVGIFVAHTTEQVVMAYNAEETGDGKSGGGKVMRQGGEWKAVLPRAGSKGGGGGGGWARG